MEVANASLAAGGAVLLSAWGAPRRACRAFLADATADADATLAVVVGEGEERFLDAWRRYGDPDGDLAVLDVGSDVRSAAATPEASRHSVVRGLPLGDVSALRQEVAAYLDDWGASERPTAVYVEAADELVPDVGLPRLVELLDGVVSTAGTAGGESYVGVAGDRSDVAAALAPGFDAVVDLAWTPDDTYRATPRKGVEAPEFDPDLAFDLLRSPRRRRTLWYLARTETATVDDVADYLARADAGLGGEPEPDDRRVQIALHQFDLPKLDDAGVVDYDAGDGTIETTDRLASLRPYLAFAAARGTSGDRST